MIPDHPDHIAAFWEYLLYIGYWFSWDYDDDKRAKPVADVWREVYENGHYEFYYGDPCGCDDSGGDGDCPVCDDYFPQEISFTYEPYDPRTEYDTVPAGFPSAPFVWGSDINLSGTAENDIFVRIPFPEQTNFRDIIEGVVNVLKSLLEIDQINNFPRLKFRFTGKGRLQVYLLKILQGGKCLITIDGKLNSARMYDLQSASLLNPTTLDVLLAELGVSLIAGTLVQEEIVEFNIEEEGDHYIDITFLPNVVPPNIGFGGGVRKINLCDMDAKAAPPIRTNPDGTVDEWDGEDWRPLPGRPSRGIINLSGEDTCECEEDMCNCAFTVKVDPCTGKMFYKDAAGATQYIDVAPPGGTPSLPPEDPDFEPTQNVGCFKATGVWDTYFALIDAIFDSWSEDLILPHVKSMGNMNGNYPQIKLDNWRHFKFWAEWLSLDRDEMQADWDGTKATMKNNFICEVQNRMGNGQYLSEDEFNYLRAFDWTHITGSLGEFLNDATGILEDNYLRERAAYYVAGELGNCNCNGGSPAPDPDVLGEDEARLVFHSFLGSVHPRWGGELASLQAHINATPKRGTQSGGAINSEFINAGNERDLFFCLKVEGGETVEIDKVKYDLRCAGSSWQWIGLGHDDLTQAIDYDLTNVAVPASTGILELSTEMTSNGDERYIVFFIGADVDFNIRGLWVDMTVNGQQFYNVALNQKVTIPSL